MNWEKVKEIMMSRGYSTTGIAKNESNGKIDSIAFIKQIPVEYCLPLSISALVTTNNPDCDSCWHVELRYAPLHMSMYISTGQLPINYLDWNKAEKVISLYGQHNRNFNPLENSQS